MKTRWERCAFIAADAAAKNFAVEQQLIDTSSIRIPGESPVRSSLLSH